MIVFVNTSITTINLIKKNPHFDFEYIFFNEKNKNNSNSPCDKKISSKNQKEKELNLIKSVEDRAYITQSFEENKEIKENEIYLSKSIKVDKEINNTNSDIITKIQPKEIFIIGGQSIYEQSIDIADKIYVTKIDYNYDGDKYFPYFNKAKYSSKILKTENLPVKHSFILYEKI